MKKDKQKTQVVFYIETGNGTDNETPFAYFINEKADQRGNNTCYAHIGQHSACSPEYIKECRKATEQEYKDLAEELESIGYNLEILP